MTQHQFHWLLLASCALLGMRAYESAAQQQIYRYAWIELPGLTDERQGVGVGGINNSGVVVGGAATSSYIYDDAAVVWDAQGRITVLESLGGSRSGTSALTDHGDFIIGKSIYEGGDPLKPRGVYWRNGAITDIGTLGGEVTSPNDLNNNEEIVGTSSNLIGRPQAFIWEGDHLRALPHLSGIYGGADGVNINSNVVGWLTDDGIDGPILWASGTEIIKLPDLGGRTATPAAPWAINDHDIIVGTAYTPNGQWHAVVWVGQQIYDIHDHRLGSSSRAMDINNNNVIVGTLGSAFSSIAFLWEQGKGMQLLDDLVPPLLRRPWRIQPKLSINDAGQMAVSAMVGGSLDQWAVLLTPVHPTMELSGPMPGVAGGVNRFAVTDAAPGARVVFAYSQHGGGMRIPGCNLQKNAIQLHEPKIVGSAIADADGRAMIERFVPPAASGRHILFQAVVVSDCAISQLVVHEFD